MSPDIALIDHETGPDTGEQFLLGDELARPLDQQDQDVECASAEMNGSIPFEQEVRRGPQTEWPK